MVRTIEEGFGITMAQGDTCYMGQDCPMTLAEGLDEFYRVNPRLERRTGTGEVDLFLTRHDTVHVVFGLSTAIDDEMLADFSAIFASDMSFRNYVAYIRPLYADGKLVEDIRTDEKIVSDGWLRTTWKVLAALPRVARLYWHSRKMKQKWPWTDHGDFLDMPLGAVRSRLGIQVL